MTRLLLMRHAKSSWKSAAQTDHERPLNKRGRNDAPRMARAIERAGWAPDLALVSDAARTEETWAWMAEQLSEPPPMHLEPSLYHGTLRHIREAILARVGDHRTILVLGHNPGWEDALEQLTGQLETMRTANVALLEHEQPWERALDRGDWALRDVLTPRQPR